MKTRVARIPRRARPLLAAALLAAPVPGLPARAADGGDAARATAALAREIQVLRGRLEALERQLDALAAQEAPAPVPPAVPAASAAAPKVTESASHRFALSSADGDWTIAPTGRVHFDMGVYLRQRPDGTAGGIMGPGTAAGGRLTSGVNARRARLGVTGRAMGDFTYGLILEAGGATDGTATIEEARIGYTGLRNTVIEIGYGAQYFMLDESTSSNDIMFLERASAVTVGGGFNAGDPRASMGFRTWGARWYASAYLTSSAPNVAHALTRRGFGAYQRVGYNFIQTEDESLHVGASAAQVFEVPNSGPGTPGSFTLSDRPEVRIDPTPLLNTGALGTAANPVTGAQVYGVEAAAAFGAAFLQGEYIRHVVRRRLGPAVDTGGGYVQASYTFGGRRAYVPSSASYSGVRPARPFAPGRGGWGAVELAARVSYTDLVDHYTPHLAAADQPFMVNGGRQTTYTLGLNWFWNANMLWKFNYIHSDFDKTGPVSAANALPLPLGLSLDVLAARMQFVF